MVALGSQDDRPMMLSELDGFVAGILICPDMILPSKWFPIVLDGEGTSCKTYGSEADPQDGA